MIIKESNKFEGVALLKNFANGTLMFNLTYLVKPDVSFKDFKYIIKFDDVYYNCTENKPTIISENDLKKIEKNVFFVVAEQVLKNDLENIVFKIEKIKIKKHKKKLKKYSLSQDEILMIENQGLHCIELKERPWFMSRNTLFQLDNIDYCINFKEDLVEKEKEQQKLFFKKSINEINEINKKINNQLIKIIDFIKQKNNNKIYVIVSKTNEYQLFIFDESGYLAILYIEDKIDFEGRLMVQYSKNNKYFKNLKLEKVKIYLSSSN